MKRRSCVKYPYLVYFIISGLKRRTRRHGRDRMREIRCDAGNAMMILLGHGQVGTIRNDVPRGCRRRCRTGRVIVGRLESMAELMCVTLMGVVMFLAIGGLVTLVRISFPRSSSVGFLVVLPLVVELDDLMRASVKSVAIRGEVRGTRKLNQTTANINISKTVF